MQRQKTPVEQQRFRGYFQNLNVNISPVTGEATSKYNSVSWSVGVSDRWLWPGNSLEDFDLFYGRLGYSRTSNGPIALWGHSINDITHSSISAGHNNLEWESKCGADLKIQHSLTELAGSTFGKVIAFYSRRQKNANGVESINDAQPDEKIEPLNEGASVLQAEVSKLPRKTVIEFEKSFEAWRNTWFAGRLAVNSNPASRTASYEFFRLIKMGESILPLVVLKLIEKDNFLALQLYNRLQPDTALIAKNGPGADCFQSGEQGRAAQTIINYLKSR